jgi:hypothetical protein
MRLPALFALYAISTAAAIASPYAIHTVEMMRRKSMPVNSEAPLEPAPAAHTAMGPPHESLVCTAGNGAEYYKSNLFTGGVSVGNVTGDRRSFIPDVVVQSCALGNDGTLYLVGTSDNQNWLRAYSQTGQLERSSARDEYCSPPALSRNGTIYLICMPHSGNTTLVAYDPEFRVQWTFPTGGFEWNPVPPAIGPDGTVYVYSGVQSAPAIIAIAAQGQKLWSAPVPAKVSQLAVTDDGTVLVNVPAGHAIAFDAQGRQLWSFYSGARVLNGGIAVAGDGTVYFAAGFLYALDKSGKPKWNFKSELTYTQGDCFDGDLVIADDGTVYARSYYNQLYAVTPDGRKKWAVTSSSPALPGLMLSSDGSLRTQSAWYSVPGGLATHGWPSSDHDPRNTRSQEEQ